MVRPLLVAVALALALPAGAASARLASASAASARAAPLIGIGDQYPWLFTDPRWQALDAHDVRYIASWNALHKRRERIALDAYLAYAKDAGARVLVSLNHAAGHVAGRRLPTVAAYAREFRAFHKRYPWIKDWGVWN